MYIGLASSVILSFHHPLDATLSEIEQKTFLFIGIELFEEGTLDDET